VKRILFTALALILIGTSSLIAQPKDMQAPMPGMMPPGHPPMGMGRMGMDNDDDCCMPGDMQGIKFTDEQRAKLDKMKLEVQKIRLEKKAQMVDLHAKLKLAMTAEKINQKDIDDIATKMGKFHQEAILQRAKHMREVRDMLTAEQKIQFDQRILGGGMGGCFDGPGPKMGRGMGMGHGGGGDCQDNCDQRPRRGRDCN